MEINFEKWQGLGNDFIILSQDIATSELAAKMCDRNFGIGADGLFCATKSNNADIAWKFFNSDGTIAQMCGNGIRCFAKYAYENKLVKSKKFSVETLAGIITPEILDNGNVVVDMGEPVLEASKIPVAVNNPMDFKVQNYNAVAVSMGNPHCVIYTSQNSEFLAKTMGAKIEVDQIFPEKTNVEFVNVISKNQVKMNVWERGCGITLACGTGACATVVAGYKKGYINNTCDVILPGGTLSINFASNNHVYMEGPATKVFRGTYLN